VVPEPVRVGVHCALAAAAGDHLVDAGGGQRLPVVHAQPQLRPPGLRVPGAGAQVPVQAEGGLVADLDDPGLAALAADGDLPLPQVDVAEPRVTGVVPQGGQLGQPDAGGPEYRDDRGIAALREAAAGTGVFQPGQLLAGEDRDQLAGDARRPQPVYRVGQLIFGGQPLEELLQGAVLVAGVRAAVPVQQPCHPLLDVLPAHLLPAGPAGQAGGGEPLHRLGVGADCLGGLALGGQAQSERADLSLEYPGVQLLGLLRGTRSRCGHGRGSLPAARHPQPSVSAAERLQSTTMTEKCGAGPCTPADTVAAV
jgi:hypothetical protein